MILVMPRNRKIQLATLTTIYQIEFYTLKVLFVHSKLHGLS